MQTEEGQCYSTICPESRHRKPGIGEDFKFYISFSEGRLPMSGSSVLPKIGENGGELRRPQGFNRRTSPAQQPRQFSAYAEMDVPQRHAELFYLQKQIFSQTPMIIVLEDGERVEGCIEWYDRNALKVRGRTKTLIYKSAIKYMFKQGENSQ
jgi:sRNA-binding regulator protein Hfq